MAVTRGDPAIRTGRSQPDRIRDRAEEADDLTDDRSEELSLVVDRAVDEPDEETVLGWFARLPDDAAARERIALRYQPLATYLAKRFANRGEAFEDLVQIANVGLMNAIDRFDPGRGVRFSTYAGATIVGELKRHFRDRRWSLRVPRRLQEIAVRITQTLPAITQRLGRSPTVAELATELGLSDEDVIEAMEASYAYSASSLDVPTREDGVAPAEQLGDDDGSLELMEDWVSLAPALRSLSDRDRRVLYLRFFGGWTQSEIAEDVGLSQMQISRILGQTLAKLREAVGGTEVDRR
ncbi:MAG TPA: SigB/SigF/SigG family RNA polymerase sigma factor [Actinomycetota bacterium]